MTLARSTFRKLRKYFEACSVETQLEASAKSIDQGQPAQFAQADIVRNFLPLVDFLYFRGLFYLIFKQIVKQNEFYGSIIMQ